ncbi:DUF2341 domain-containing protein [Candidatus Peregrinibacteria bacterium]|nr:MAG: DUF2341 domain-containing protein [Candidatus Peregrinibacteria bacterium]
MQHLTRSRAITLATLGVFGLLFGLVGLQKTYAQAVVTATCDNTFYVTEGNGTDTNVDTLNTSTAVLSNAGTATSVFATASGYRTTDDFLYGIHPTVYDVYQIDAVGGNSNLSINNGGSLSGTYVAGAISQDGNTYYVASFNDNITQPNIATIDLTASPPNVTGVQNLAYQAGDCMSCGSVWPTLADFAVNPADGLLTAYDPNTTQFVTINPATGVVTPFGATQGTNYGGEATGFDNTGALYLSNASTGTLYRALINLANGTVSVSTVATGSTTTNTSGAMCSSNYNEVGNFVWSDTDADGIQDGGEPGLDGITVALFSDVDTDGIAEPGGDDGSAVSTTTTAGGGFYRFSGVAAGDYFVAVSVPAGYSISTADQGGDDTVDSDINVTTQVSAVFTLSTGLNSTVDAGLSVPANTPVADLSPAQSLSQTNWDGGVGTSVSNQYSATSGTDTSTTGQFTLGSGGWYNPSWTHRRAITVDSTKVAADLTNYPLLITGANLDANFFSNVKADGGDIEFTAADGTTLLDKEIVSINTGSSTLEAYVRIPSLSSSANTVIYMYYGNAGATLANDTATWNSTYSAVWHMNEDPTISTDGPCGGSTFESCDSTSYTNSLNVTGDPVSTAGKIGNAVDLNGNDYFIATAASGDELQPQLSDFTYSTWIRLNATGGAPNILGLGWQGSVESAILRKRSNDRTLVVVDDGASTLTTTADGTAFTTTNWALLTVTFDRDGSIQRYYNGVADGVADNMSSIGSIDRVSVPNFAIGADATGAAPLNADLDEVRVLKTLLTPQWILTEYRNQNSPGTFYTPGSHETFSGPSTTGTLTSAIFDVGNTSSTWGTMTFNASNANGVTVYVRTDSDPAMATAPAFGTCAAITHGTDISANNCVTDGERYMQYQIVLDQVAGFAPVMQDITIQALSATSTNVAEEAGTVNLTASIDRISASNVTVPFTVSGTAANPSDHDLVNGSIVITAGNLSANQVINLTNDATPEATETIISTMGVPTNASAGNNSVYTINILDIDGLATADICDFVWIDADADGIQDGGETGLDGVTVSLYADADLDGIAEPGADDGAAVSSTTTAGGGAYSFTSVTAGDYFVVFTNPGGYTFSSQDQGGDDTVDSDANTSTGATAVFSLAGTNIISVDAGIYQTATVGNFVWTDTNGDGIQGGGETGLNGVTVSLYADADLDGIAEPGADDGAAVSTTVTAGGGLYSFSALNPGAYFLVFTTPGGYSASPANVGGDDTVDSDGLTTVVFTLTSGANNTTFDQGFYQVGSVGNFVWVDADADGIQDGGEAGLDGVTVSLYADADADGLAEPGADDGAPLGTPVTAGGGFFSFGSLAPGPYFLVVTTPGGYTITLQNQGADDAVDSDISPSNGRTAVFNLDSGQNYNTADAGFYLTASVGNFVWTDLDADGIQDGGEAGLDGVTVSLYADTDLDGLAEPGADDGAAVSSTTTAGGGLYSFSALTPGAYFLVFTTPGGYSASPANVGGDDTVDSDGLTTVVFTLTSGTSNTSFDQGFYQGATLGNFVWVDADGDGVQDGGELGLDGVTVSLYADADLDGLAEPGADDGAAVSSTTTAGGGLYSFGSLAPGDYFVTFGTASGYVRSALDQGGNDAVDSDANASTGVTAVYTVTSGQTDNTVDAGYTPLGTIGDFVWSDTDGDGVQDGGELGINGVTIDLYTDTDSSGTRNGPDVLVATQTTAGGGAYDFTGLAAVDYLVNITDTGNVLTTYTFTTANNPLAVTLGIGQDYNAADFGYQPPVGAASIGDIVWADTDKDGVYDAGESGIDSVTLTLYSDVNSNGVYDASDTVVSSTITVGGAYSFPNLSPGNYLVRVTDSRGTLSSFVLSSASDVKAVTLGSGQTDNTVDFGYSPPSIAINSNTYSGGSSSSSSSSGGGGGGGGGGESSSNNNSNNSNTTNPDSNNPATDGTTETPDPTDSGTSGEVGSGSTSAELVAKRMQHDDVQRVAKIPATGIVSNTQRAYYQLASLFPDVNINSPYYESAVHLFLNRGITGNPDGSMRFNDTINRVEFLATLFRSAQVDVPTNNDAFFADTIEGAWYQPYLNYAVQGKIVKGVGDNRFAPSAPVRYGEALKMIAETFDLIAAETEIPTDGNWPVPYFTAMNERNLIPASLLVSNDWGKTLTRGDVFQLISRIVLMIDSSQANYTDQISVSIPAVDIEGLPAQRTILSEASVWVNDLNQGAGFYEEIRPGHEGKLIIFGHSLGLDVNAKAYNAAFEPVQTSLQVGDTVTVTRFGQTETYRVTERNLVDEREIEAITDGILETDLILFTCDDDLSQRWVFRAERAE